MSLMQTKRASGVLNYNPGTFDNYFIDSPLKSPFLSLSRKITGYETDLVHSVVVIYLSLTYGRVCYTCSIVNYKRRQIKPSNLRMSNIRQSRNAIFY